MSFPKKKSNPPNWADLPIEIWAAIAKKLSSSIGDYLTFRGVCRSWRSAATFENFDSATPRVPWLMYVSSEDKKRPMKKSVKLLDLSTRKSHKVTNFNPMDVRACLSCGGWILCVSCGNGGEVCLAHPVWPAKIELPRISTFPKLNKKDGEGDRFLMKMVLSCSPTRKTGDFVVFVIWGSFSKHLGFSRPGDKSWTVIDGGQSFTDIIHHNGKLYAVDSEGTVVECDIHGPNPTQVRQVFSLPKADAAAAADAVRERILCYLVESCGKFVIVIRHIFLLKTSHFEAFEIELKDGSHKQLDNWNKALFLGFNSSVCVEEAPDWDVVKPNCIYYMDDCGKLNKDLAVDVFCLSSMTRIPLSLLENGAFLSPSTWVVPSF